MDLAAYRAEAESFVSALDREYYLHYSGQRDEYEIETIYDRHAALFGRAAVDDLRESRNRHLLEFAVHGLVGRETKGEQGELARREAALELTLDGGSMTFRESSVLQANAEDPERRAAIEAARNAVLEEELMPLLRELFDRSRAVAVELGWPSMLALCEETSGIDIGALAGQTDAFLDATEDRYEAVVGRPLEDVLGFGLDRLRRSDLPAFFRAPALDGEFPAERLIDNLEETLGGMGIDMRAQDGVIVDAEPRERKSPRAFCAPVHVPKEVYLVIAPIGGREDYGALFHEAGHTEHYAHVDGGLPAEHRYFGDNSVTEGFAFLFEHLVESPEWLERRLGIADPQPVLEHARAVKLLFLRRYCAKLAYERELHSTEGSNEGLADLYARRLSEAVHIDWPRATYLSDVDPFFYVACYLRAWALETHLRRTLRERFGQAWFEEPGAGEFLRSIWRHGQRLDADELLSELSGEELDFSVLLEEV